MNDWPVDHSSSAATSLEIFPLWHGASGGEAGVSEDAYPAGPSSPDWGVCEGLYSSQQSPQHEILPELGMWPSADVDAAARGDWAAQVAASFGCVVSVPHLLSFLFLMKMHLIRIFPAAAEAVRLRTWATYAWHRSPSGSLSFKCARC